MNKHIPQRSPINKLFMLTRATWAICYVNNHNLPFLSHTDTQHLLRSTCTNFRKHTDNDWQTQQQLFNNLITALKDPDTCMTPQEQRTLMYYVDNMSKTKKTRLRRLIQAHIKNHLHDQKQILLETHNLVPLITENPLLIYVTDILGNTLLHRLIDHQNPNTESLEQLLESIDINAQSHDGSTPLHLAVTYKNHALLEQFLETGAIVDETNNRGETAFLTACANRDYPSVISLLEHGANPNYCDNNGNNALHLLLSNRVRFHSHHPLSDHEMNQLVQHLCHAGVDPDLRNSERETAREYRQWYHASKISLPKKPRCCIS